MALKDELPGSVPDTAAVERVWRRVHERETPRFVVYWLAPIAVAAAIAVWAVRPDEILRTLDGQLLDVALKQSESAQVITLSDASELRIAANAVLRTRASNAHVVDLDLSTGKIDVFVTPGGPRRWSISADDVRVEVVGTRFSVDVVGKRVRVEVQKGQVQVSGPRAGLLQVRAGEFFETPSLPASAPAPVIVEPPPQRLPESVHKVTWRALAAKGRFRDAARKLLAEGGWAEEAQKADSATLLVLSDMALANDERKLALNMLRRVRSGPEQATAAYKLGLLLLEDGRNVEAAESLEKAIELGLPPGLKEQALERVKEARR